MNDAGRDWQFDKVSDNSAWFMLLLHGDCMATAQTLRIAMQFAVKPLGGYDCVDSYWQTSSLYIFF